MSSLEWWNETDFGADARHSIRARLLHEEETEFQKLKIFEHRVYGRVLVLDDVIQTTSSDECIYHEMLVRVPVFGHPLAGDSARKLDVLIIGGGDGGILRELLSLEQVRSATMCEIDGRVVEICAEQLGFQGNYEDPRTHLVIGDGAAFVKEAADEAFDLVVIDSTDPFGPSLVLYTEDFHRELRRIMKPDGVLSRHMGIPHVQSGIYEPIWPEIGRVFPDFEVMIAAIPTYLGGHMCMLIASRDGHSSREPQVSSSGRYYDSEMHRAAFALPRMIREKIFARMPERL